MEARAFCGVDELMGKIVFLLEEPSMKYLLENLLPRLFPDLVFQCIPHEGKTQLDRSIPVKLKAWREPGVRFVIVRDNDNVDCRAMKQRLQELCAQGEREDTLIRLVCQELESWYLGDLSALANAYELRNIDTPRNRKKYREPDAWEKPSVEVKRLVPSFQKLDGARRLGRELQTMENASPSFRIFVSGVAKVMAEMNEEAKA